MALARHTQAFVVNPLKAYASETRDLLPCPRPSTVDKTELGKKAASADLVLFVKTGCGHCAQAKESTAGLDCSRVLVHLDSVEERRGLAVALGLPVVTVPVCFVRGHCVGDGEALRALVGDGSAIARALARSKKEAPFNDPNLVAWTERHLCRPPGGGGSNFFLSVYANTVRSLSAIHCLFFALVLALPLEIARIGASIFLVDLVLFLGSAQISPMALACTSLLWVRRGPVVPAIPYKVKCRKMVMLILPVCVFLN